MKTFLIALKTQLLEFHGIASDIFTFKNVFTPSAIVPLIFSGILALNFSNLLLLFFLIFYFLDFATGILATTIEIKNNPDKYAELKERKGKVYWIESERIVRGIVKMVIYIQLILLSNLITVAIDNKQFQLHQSVIPLSIYEIMLCLCITAEFVSNLENSKRAGFDIIQLLSDGFSKFWRIFKIIKTGKDE